MNIKFILFIVYSILIFLMGYFVKEYKIEKKNTYVKLSADTLLYQNFVKSRETLRGKTKKPEKIKHQKIDSNKIKKIVGSSNIIEVSKKDNILKVLNYKDSILFLTSFLSKNDNYIIYSENSLINYYEDNELLVFKAPRIGLGSKFDFKNGSKTILFESTFGISIFRKVNFDIRVNSLPEFFLMLSYDL